MAKYMIGYKDKSIDKDKWFPLMHVEAINETDAIKKARINYTYKGMMAFTEEQWQEKTKIEDAKRKDPYHPYEYLTDRSNLVEFCLDDFLEWKSDYIEMCKRGSYPSIKEQEKEQETRLHSQSLLGSLVGAKPFRPGSIFDTMYPINKQVCKDLDRKLDNKEIAFIYSHCGKRLKEILSSHKHAGEVDLPNVRRRILNELVNKFYHI